MKKPIKVRDKIKYDRKDVRLYGKLALISFLLMVFFIVFAIVYDLFVERNYNATVITILLLGTPCSVIVCLCTALLYLDGKIYISDLKQNGFVVPESKRFCDYKLSALIREEQSPQEGTIHKRHLVLAIVTGVITIVTAVYTMTLSKVPHPVVVVIMLLITGLLFWQSFNRFFKNDIDIDAEDSRWIRPRVVPAMVGVGMGLFVLWMGVQLIHFLPISNVHYYAQIVRYHKREDAQEYRYYMDRLPSYAEDIRFVSWGNACGVSFYVPQENVKDIQAYYEGIGDPYIIHTIQDGEEEFTKLCNRIKDYTTYFRSEDYANCMVYEFPGWYVDQWGNTTSWHVIMDTNRGEIGYGYCPTDW